MMENKDCIFCKIAKGEIPSYKIYEDKNFIAFLDIFPNTRGMTLLIPKQHYDSYVFDMPDDVYKEFLLTAKKIGKLIDEKINVTRTAMVTEGMGVNHAHIKLYPLHGIGKDFKAIIPEGNKYFEKYEGYLSTILGPKANDEDLNNVRNLFKEK
ncbi:MAG: HIT domain-containing protein [Ignavibacteria bacterium]|nr:HIT domain-containing protein [Ignavibacteria bacterium]